MNLRRRATALLKALSKLYPDARCELIHRGPFQLLVATILSAQCTDRAVNRVTPGLFKAYPNPLALAGADLKDVEAHIRTLGLYRNKARHLMGMAAALVRDHSAKVPRTREALVALPGVGRKTANVVLSNAFDLPGLAVDTHVLRVGKRLGLFSSQDPVKVEAELGVLIPPARWGLASHLFIWHGRRHCVARSPQCSACALKNTCPKTGLTTFKGS